LENSLIPAEAQALDSLRALVRRLRGAGGCPWDRQQTPRSIASYLVEEAYEVVDAIAAGDSEAICEELGDVLFHIVFIAEIFQESGHFDLTAVMRRITAKMVRRHPHVFADKQVSSADEVREQWQRIKAREKPRDAHASLLDGVAAGLPPLIRARRISQRAAAAGFDWDDISGVMAKVEEEWAELRRALKAAGSNAKAHRAAEMEFGDVLFTLVNVARFAGFTPDTALGESIRKFERRFRWMEKELHAQGRTLSSASRRHLDELWEHAKGETQA